MKYLHDLSVALLVGGIVVPACAQPVQSAASPRPETPFSAKPMAQDQFAAAERQLQTMQDVHQRFMQARTPRERQALMAEHSKAMRDGLAVMEGMHGPGSGPGMGPGMGMGGRHMHQHMALMNAMMRMMMERIDLLSAK